MIRFIIKINIVIKLYAKLLSICKSPNPIPEFQTRIIFKKLVTEIFKSSKFSDKLITYILDSLSIIKIIKIIEI